MSKLMSAIELLAYAEKNGTKGKTSLTKILADGTTSKASVGRVLVATSVPKMIARILSDEKVTVSLSVDGELEKDKGTPSFTLTGDQFRHVTGYGETAPEAPSKAEERAKAPAPNGVKA